MGVDNPFEIGVRRRAAGDQYSDSLDEMSRSKSEDPATVHPLDTEAARKLHTKLMDWLFHERTKQAENRLQMAMDSDFYDGEQWDAEDAATVKDRGQVPLVFNETAPMVDWLIGTERRTRVDWMVLPRAEDDVQAADAKGKVIKFVSDLNKIPFARSRAFSDAVKVGVGWLDDGARDDPTKDVLYSAYEDWRRVLHDSSGYDLDLEDSRYLFRWRWVDDDLAEISFPDRKDVIRRAVIDSGTATEAEIDADWYLGEPVSTSGTLYASGAGVFGQVSRRRIKLIECQFRMPAKVKIVGDGPMRGAYLGDHDLALIQAVQSSRASIIEKTVMRMHVAVMTEEALLSVAPSIYRHNRFSLTPIWCYRRGKDRLPYGAIRRIRDIQQDLNKRASKALFLLSTNQIIADENAVADKDVARYEADQPDGYIEVKAGKNFKIQRDTDAATGQIQMMTLDAQSIQKTAGVNNENLGRQTNAQSGEAIKARQIQGAVGTTEPFDNHRYAVQTQGEKILSLIEQFYTEEKVVRLTGSGGKKLDWLRINVPEVQPDGSVRYINDISASMADFVVSEQDYAGTLRQAMFESMMNVASKFPPELAVRFMRMAYEFSDLANKDAIVEEIRKITGERDPNKELTPEEEQQAMQDQQAQLEAMQMQREAAALAVDLQRAQAEKVAAEAEAIRAKVGGVSPEQDRAIRQIQEQAADRLDAMAEQLRKVQVEAANKTMAINKDADVRLEAERIKAASQERIAEIQNVAAKQIDALLKRMDDLAKSIQEVGAKADGAAAKGGNQAGGDGE